MPDVQNERTDSQNRRRHRRPRGERGSRPEQKPPTMTVETAPTVASVVADPPQEIRPPEIEPPTERFDVYCAYHAASEVEGEPIQMRTGMATLRHLAVGHFGGATLYCDCMHSGPHQWPPSMQKLETAIELDQYLAASTNEA